MNLRRKHLSHVGARFSASPLGRISTIKPLPVCAGLLLVSAFVAPSVLGDCKCHRPNKEETTRQGANMVIVEVEKEPYRQLEGTIGMYDDRKIENALVEAFDNPDYLLDENHSQKRPEQKRLAACVTADDGKFCFRNLPSGKYELRSSLDGGWNITHIYVVVDKKAGKHKPLHVTMSVGT
jgi:hypothetical protein